MLHKKIKEKSARIAILGLGHVGFPLAMLFAKKGFKTLGFEINPERIKTIRNEWIHSVIDYLSYSVEGEEKIILKFKNLLISNDEKILKDTDIFIVAVPTPLKEEYIPNLSYIEKACKLISKFIKKDSLVVIESTLYPGATEEIVKPLLEKSGLVAGKDFYLCFSPERIDPGNKKWKIENIPKIIGGLDKKSKELGVLLYLQIVEKVVPVSSLKVAEATKILENLFRSVNIALIYDLTRVFEKMGIDIWEVIEAASTKPFAFIAHYPGPGVGGHCIPKDPLYLLYKVRKMGLNLKFIEEASEINRNMPLYVLHLVEETLEKKGKKLRDSKMGVLGVTYKKDVKDLKGAPAKIIIEELLGVSKEVIVFDPLVEEAFGAKRGSFEEAIKDRDCIILITDHTFFKKNKLEEKINKFSPFACVIDTRNFINSKKLKKTITYRCLGKPFNL